ncbi:uncharacterized protein LOC134468528 [Engraulis encrasicolus]|uniref:uncharacterized protein LOC134468528 n=1 Tax=Engraulis encrasicolus TaxID=184585 RepID=UPI002FCF5CAB
MAEGPASLNEPLTDQWDLCEEATKELDCRTVRFFSKVPGDIQNHIKDLKSYLNVPHFTEVSSTDWCDVILNFCPVDSDSDSASRIQEVIKEIPDCKPAILVLMHHTSEPEYTVPDSSGFGKEGAVHIVNFLYQEEEGLLKCPQNDRARTTFLEALGSFEQWDTCEDAEHAECPTVRFHSIVPGTVKKHVGMFKEILDGNPEVTKVSGPKWSDVTMAFCPIVSRVGTDIEAALKNIEDSKPGILVAMHHTFDREYVIPNTKRFSKSKDVLIVDCLFHEDMGLLRCKANDDAWQAIQTRVEEEVRKKHLEEEQKKGKSAQTSEKPDNDNADDDGNLTIL